MLTLILPPSVSTDRAFPKPSETIASKYSSISDPHSASALNSYVIVAKCSGPPVEINSHPSRLKKIPINVPLTSLELAVKQCIEDEVIKNLDAIANPDSLNQFKNIKDLNE